MGKPLGVGSNQSRLHFDHGGEALFEILKGNIEWTCYPQRVLVPGVAEPMKPPMLVIVGYSPRVTLPYHAALGRPRLRLLVPLVSPGGLYNFSAAEELCLSSTSHECIYHAPRMHDMPVPTG